MTDCITTSIFDIFKTGPGPSSSHTIGPMRAALLFRDAMETLPLDTPKKGLELTVYLFGSLSHTGKGHGTHRAVLGGLLGWEPASCDCDLLGQLLEDPEKRYDIPFGKEFIQFSPRHIHFEGEGKKSLPVSNTLRFKLSRQDQVLLEKEYYSIGGGFIQCKGEIEAAKPTPPHAYRNMNQLRKILHKTGLSLSQVILENAAEIALKHQLGMTCDPVGGYVQIPCIERNAVGAVTAVNAYILAEAGNPARQKITFDEVVETMMKTGQDMCTRYKETGLGGLAVCCVSC